MNKISLKVQVKGQTYESSTKFDESENFFDVYKLVIRDMESRNFAKIIDMLKNEKQAKA